VLGPPNGVWGTFGGGEWRCSKGSREEGVIDSGSIGKGGGTEGRCHIYMHSRSWRKRVVLMLNMH
jgi:hypothetical protein